MSMLQELQNQYEKDRFSLDEQQLRVLLDYVLIQYEIEKNANIDFCKEWVHKSKVRQLREQIEKILEE